MKIFFRDYEEFKPLMDISTEVFYDIQKFVFNSPDIAKKILSHRDSELHFLNETIADYIGEDCEDERTKKIALLFAGYFHSFISMASNIIKQKKTFESYSIVSEFPWKLDNIDNNDVFLFLIGGIDRLHDKLFN